jgi:dinuclear metal center YbgI/SA1388 family protein
MITRDKLLDALSIYLKVEEIPEFNGLQVEGKTEIKKIVFGVSAHMALFEAALKENADMIITHHGLIWEGVPERITGVFGKRVAFLLKHNINLVSYHLPLDRHPVVGNNAQLAKVVGLKKTVPFGKYCGIDIGVLGEFKEPKYVQNICLELGGESIFTGPEKTKKIAIVSGGAHNLVEQAAVAGADFYITGSRDEYVVEYCREAKMNFLSMGHYNLEKYGTQALMKYTADNFDADVKFIDISNPF